MKSHFLYPQEEDLISIILLSYNTGDPLFDAIDSIIMQDYPKIELIVTDDGSKDFNEDEIENYIIEHKKDNILSHLVIHRKTNIGTVKNINAALEMSRGEYIRILGGDDAYPTSTVLRDMIDILMRDNRIAVVGKWLQCNENLEPIHDDRTEKSNKAISTVLELGYIEGRKYITKNNIFPIANQAICYRREFFEKYGLCDERYFLIEDVTLAHRVLKEASNVGIYDDYAVKHRAKGGISSSKEMFSPRRILYYKDALVYAENDIDKSPEIYNWLYRKESIRINKFVYLMAKSKKDNRRYLMPLLCICYLDAVIYYTCTRPVKLMKRIISRIQK